MLGAIIGAGASLASSLLGKSSADKAAKQNYKHQKEFAQNAVQWKVKDAKAAKIHPLAALGAPTMSFTNTAGGHDYSGLASAGQDLGRALDATRDKGERVDAYTSELRKLQLEKGRLENDVLRADLASRVARVKQAPGHPPASPNPQNPDLIAGQGDSPGIENKPMERQGWDNRNPAKEAGSISDVGYSWTGTGYAPVMSNDFKQRSEEDPWAVVGHWARHRIGPSFQLRSTYKPPFPAPGGHYWRFHPGAQEYRLFKYTKGAGRYSAPENTWR